MVVDSNDAHADTQVGGSITTDVIWNVAGNPYVVTSDVTLAENVSLVIEPGVRVQFDNGTRLTISGNAVLTANADSNSPVVFTSNAGSPQAGEWYGIVFNRDSTGALENVVIEYAQYGAHVIGRGAKTLSHCEIRRNTQGIRAQYDNTIPQVTVNDSSLYENSQYNYTSVNGPWNTTTLEAQGNWWGTADPEAIANTIFDFFDNSSRAVVDYSGFLDGPDGSPVPGNYLIGATGNDNITLEAGSYIVPGSYWVRPGHLLTVPAGTTLSFGAGRDISVDGSLTVEGSDESKVTFTSNAGSPQAGEWTGIVFNPDSTGALSHTVIEYAQYGVHVIGSGDVTLSHCEIRRNTQGIRAQYDNTIPQVTVNDSSLYENSQYNYTSVNGPWNTTTLDARGNWWGTADPEAIANTIFDFFDNSSRAVVDYSGFLDGPDGSPVPGNYLIGATGNDNITLEAGSYIVPGSYWVRPGHLLTVPAGTTLSFGAGRDISVDGSLTVEGSDESKVTFTSNAGSPQAGEWTGIVFNPDSTGALSHTVIEYAQYGVHVIGSGDVTLSHCEIRRNTQGIRVKYDNTIPQVTVNDSSLYENSQYNYTSVNGPWNTTTLEAQGNWWGTADPEAIANTIFDFFDNSSRAVVDYSGFLDGPDGSPVPGNYLIGATGNDNITLEAGSYIVPGSYWVRPGHLLTVPAGTTLSFGAGRDISVDGSLTVEGSDESKVTLTSNAGSPQAGEWTGIVFNPDSTGALSHTVIEYAQHGVHVIGSGDVTLSHCEIRRNTQGIRAQYNNTIPQVTVNDSSLYENSQYNYTTVNGTWNTTTLDARGNWWGTADPEAIANTIFDFFDNSSRAVVDYSGFLDGPDGSPVPGNYLIGATGNDNITLEAGSYIVPGSYWVRPGHFLTVPAGTTLSFGAGRDISVDGSLTVEGSDESKVTFTSNAGSPQAGEWTGIVFNRDSTGTFSHMVVEYAKVGVHVIGRGTKTLSHCTLRRNTRGIQVQYDKTIPEVTVNDCSLYENVEYCYFATGNGWGDTILNAENNWWGTDNADEIEDEIYHHPDNAKIAEVDYTPWLQDPNSTDAAGDFNGDNTSDIFFRNETSGATAIWLMASGIRSGVTYPGRESNLTWEIKALEDFNGDGTTDVFWRNNTSGTTAVWLMNNGVRNDVTYPGRESNLDWHIEQAGDFNGDGTADIFFRNSSSGTTAVWLMNNGTRSGVTYPGRESNLDWHIEQAGDFNGDGTADIFFRNSSSGTTAVWLMNNGIRSGVTYPGRESNLDWHIEQAGDFNGDGTADILFRNSSSGTTAIWLMNNGTRSGVTYPGRESNLDWHIEQAGDFNGDGTADILFRNSASGNTAVWLMNNGTRSSVTYPGRESNLDWQIQ